MKVKLLVSLSGANGAFDPGDLYECDKAEAGRLIEAGFAEAVQAKPGAKREKAVKKTAAVETRG